MAIDEKMELLITHYSGCYDLIIAKLKVPDLTDEEFNEIKDNDYFIARINSIDAGQQEMVMNNLIDLARSANENVKLRATLELGKIFYKRKFDTKSDVTEEAIGNMPTIVMKGVYPDE